MIFVTVGTHEQPFDRLIRYVDGLKGNGTISEDAFILVTVPMSPCTASGKGYFHTKRL